MALQYSPKIVTDSLVMCLDASNNKSYPAADLPVKGGLVMWMDAADDTTFSYSSGTTVSQWRDKSGFNYHMVPKSSGPTRNAFLNSRKALAFTTSQTIGNDTINLASSANTVFVVSRLTGVTNGRVLTCNLDSGGNNWLLGHHGGTSNAYYAEGWVYDSSGASTSFQIYMGDWSGSSTDLANFYINGTAYATNNTAASAGPNKLGINYYSIQTSTCEAAEIIVFNRVLSTAERRLVHTYLGQKWGISNTDRSIIDLSGFDDNGSFGGAAGSQTIANMPTFDFYNKGSLSFDGSNDYITIPSSASIKNTSSLTLEAWIYISNSMNYYGGIFGKGTTDTDEEYCLLVHSVNSKVYMDVGSGGGPYTDATFSFSLNTWYHIIGTHERAAGSSAIKIYVNGSLLSSSTVNPTNAVNDNSTAVTIGSRFSTGGSPWNGKIANAKIYTRTLSATEVAQNYEAQKSKFANTIVQQGLVLNLDAGNPYSYAGAGTTWYDVSGGGYNAAIVNAPTFISDGIKYFTCSSTQNFTISNPISSQPKLSQIWTVSAWVNIDTTTGAGVRYLISGLNSGVFVEYVDSGTLLYLNGGIDDYYTYGNSIEGSGWVMLTFLFRNSDGYRKIYNNLIDITTSGPNNTSTPAGNSATFTIANNMIGKIAQIMMYNRLLTVAEITQNYNALKGRFGL